MCPSGLNHKIKTGIVKDTFGNKWCWHSDCMDAVIDIATGNDRKFMHIESGDKGYDDN
jgi:hypothetical protein